MGVGMRFILLHVHISRHIRISMTLVGMQMKLMQLRLLGKMDIRMQMGVIIAVDERIMGKRDEENRQQFNYGLLLVFCNKPFKSQN